MKINTVNNKRRQKKVTVGRKTTDRMTLFENTMLDGARLAKVLSITPQTVNRLASTGVLERIGGEVGKQKGRFHLQQSVARHCAWKVREAKELSPREGKHKDALTRRMEAVASREELALKREQGEMIKLETVHLFLADMILRTRASIMSVPSRISRKVDDRTIVTMMRDELRRALSGLSKDFVERAEKEIESELDDEEADYE